MNRSTLAGLFGTCMLALLTGPLEARAQVAITEQEAHAIGVEAYLYFYPLISMDITRLTSTNIEASKEPLKGPMNTFVSAAAYPPGDLKLVVRINFDTLYSVGWLDLTKEPVVVSSPDTNGRYFLLPTLDMWTDVFASPGWRTTGTQAQNFLIVPPGWRPDLRDRVVEDFKLPKDIQRIDAPTPYVAIIGRTKSGRFRRASGPDVSLLDSSTRPANEGPEWVKTRKAQSKQISSALPLIATDAPTSRIGSSVPGTDMVMPLPKGGITISTDNQLLDRRVFSRGQLLRQISARAEGRRDAASRYFR